jgi:hypothetical protein
METVTGKTARNSWVLQEIAASSNYNGSPYVAFLLAIAYIGGIPSPRLGAVRQSTAFQNPGSAKHENAVFFV